MTGMRRPGWTHAPTRREPGVSRDQPCRRRRRSTHRRRLHGWRHTPLGEWGPPLGPQPSAPAGRWSKRSRVSAVLPEVLPPGDTACIDGGDCGCGHRSRCSRALWRSTPCTAGWFRGMPVHSRCSYDLWPSRPGSEIQRRERPACSRGTCGPTCGTNGIAERFHGRRCCTPYRRVPCCGMLSTASCRRFERRPRMLCSSAPKASTLRRSECCLQTPGRNSRSHATTCDMTGTCGWCRGSAHRSHRTAVA